MFAFLRPSNRPALSRRLALVLSPVLMSVGLLSAPAHAEETVDAETAAAINVTMDYWTSAMPSQFNREWYAPALFDAGYGYNSLYDGSASNIYCGTTRLAQDNAYACESDTDNWVAFDVELHEPFPDTWRRLHLRHRRPRVRTRGPSAPDIRGKLGRHRAPSRLLCRQRHARHGGLRASSSSMQLTTTRSTTPSAASRLSPGVEAAATARGSSARPPSTEAGTVATPGPACRTATSTRRAQRDPQVYRTVPELEQQAPAPGHLLAAWVTDVDDHPNARGSRRHLAPRTQRVRLSGPKPGGRSRGCAHSVRHLGWCQARTSARTRCS